MRVEIGAYEAKTKLPELLRQVRKGKSFTITHRGEAVAELVPPGHIESTDAAQAVADMKAFMRSHRIRGVDIRALTEEGRR